MLTSPTLTRRKSLPQATQDASQISQTALQLYEELAYKEKRYPFTRNYGDRILKSLKESSFKLFLIQINAQNYRATRHYRVQYGIYQRG